MTPKLNSEQLQALHDGDDRPIEVVDPETNRIYILLAQEQYERLKPLFEGVPVSTEEQREIIREAGRRAGWDDPEMDVYDRYDEERSKQP